MNPNELHEERLATTDEFGHRVYLYPEDVKGTWKVRRSWVYGLLIFIFMVVPWIHFKGQQIILLNIPARKFVFFGETFFGHDAPFLIFILLSFVLLMGFVTTVWGRVWCGWACPQTVFIQAIYSKIEKWTEGPARRRQKRDSGPWTIEKSFRKSVKWFLFLIVSLHLSHSFLGYFVGTRELLVLSSSAPSENFTLFFTMLFFTALFLFDFGWFREQFCIIACPYGRFQSVMMDESSMVIAYDDKRGEPRRDKHIAKEDEGDCVNCYQCVRACPTGIDIRRGASQLECIACTQCIDACDEIMLKVNKPKGLIRYSSEVELRGGQTKWIRPRSIAYGFFLILVVGAFLFSLERRQDLSLAFIRTGSAPFQEIEKGLEVLNQYSVKIDHHKIEPLQVVFKVEDPRIRIVTQRVPTLVEKGPTSIGIFIRFHPEILEQGSRKVFIKIYDQDTEGSLNYLTEKEVNLVGPF